jgi:hypothetical protein
LNEPVPLRRIEPLHHTLFSSQRCLLLASEIPTQVIATLVASRGPWNCIGLAFPHKRPYRPISGGILA